MHIHNFDQSIMTFFTLVVRNIVMLEMYWRFYALAAHTWWAKWWSSKLEGAELTKFYRSHPLFHLLYALFILWRFWSCPLISVTQWQMIYLLDYIWSLMVTFLHAFSIIYIVIWHDSNSAFETSFVASFLHCGTNGATRCRHLQKIWDMHVIAWTALLKNSIAVKIASDSSLNSKFIGKKQKSQLKMEILPIFLPTFDFWIGYCAKSVKLILIKLRTDVRN